MSKFDYEVVIRCNLICTVRTVLGVRNQICGGKVFITDDDGEVTTYRCMSCGGSFKSEGKGDVNSDQITK